MLELAFIIFLFVFAFLPDGKIVKKSFIEVATEEDVKVFAKNVRKIYLLLAVLFSCHALYEIVNAFSSILSIPFLLIWFADSIVTLIMLVPCAKTNSAIRKKYNLKLFGK